MSTPSSISKPGHRIGARARWLLPTLGFWVLVSCRGEERPTPDDAAEWESAAAEAAVDWPCEAKGYPCTWEEVSAETTERTFALADQALDRFEPGKEAELVAWLEAQPDVAEAVEEAPTVVWFRLTDGAPVYVHVHGAPASSTTEPGGDTSLRPEPRVVLASAGHWADLPGRVRSVLSRRSATAVMPGVTGRDRTDDRRVNQRDIRKALVLDPMRWETCVDQMHESGWIELARQTGAEGSELEKLRRERQRAVNDVCTDDRGPELLTLVNDRQGVDGGPHDVPPSQGEVIRRQLEETRGYRGNVRLLTNDEVDLGAFDGWQEYDVIHVATHGAPATLTVGSNLEWAGKGRLTDAQARRRGLFPWVATTWDLEGAPKRKVWGANARFFRALYPRGLDRTLIFLNSCSGAGDPRSGTPSPLASALLGSQSMLIGWGAPADVIKAERTAIAFFFYMMEGWTGMEAMKRIPKTYGDFVAADLSGPSSTQAAIRRSGAHLWFRGSDMRIREVTRLLHPPGRAGPSGQAIQDGDPMEDLLIGELEDGVDDALRVSVEVDAILDEERMITSVHLELDGTRIGSSKDLTGVERIGSGWRLNFDRVPVGKDLEAEKDYELEAVVRLPEQGESRYAAILSSRACYWELELESSPRAGRYSGNVANVMAPPGGEILIQLTGTDPYMMINVAVRGAVSPTGERRFSIGGIFSPAARSRGWVDPPDDGAATIVFQAEPLMSHLVYTTGDGTPIYDTVNGTSQQVGEYPPFSDLYLRGDPASSVRGRMTGLLAVSPDIASPPTEQVRAELRFRAKNAFGPGGMPRFDVCGRGS